MKHHHCPRHRHCGCWFPGAVELAVMVGLLIVVVVAGRGWCTAALPPVVHGREYSDGSTLGLPLTPPGIPGCAVAASVLIG